MKRKFLTVVGFATGISFAKPRDRVDVYFEDGSMVSFVAGSPEAEKLLPVAGDVLAAARR
ncbi:MAG: hypothetical protein E6G67_13305 [Actinobacteria bacterium]|nr:MAG: hypothetical protein E6G67_13305 [Actinomycetota bacterium]